LRIGIIDSGINPKNLKHKRIIEGIIIGIKDDRVVLFGNGEDTRNNGHGTMCARIIEKISPDSQICSVKVLNSENMCSVKAIVEAIRYCIDNKMNIINISIATSDINKLDELQEICLSAYKQNIVIVAAKENNSTQPSYPADLDHVIAVDYKIMKDGKKSLNFLRINSALILLRASVGGRVYMKKDWVFKKILCNSFITACITGGIAQNVKNKEAIDIERLYNDLGGLI